ncbi:MAG: hypothetical protein HZA31_04660 [Opitutae bacterium]|nr:hypothetical protein [Opitutae bacterium]
MNPLHRDSLHSTLDSLAESLFFQRTLSAIQRRNVAAWIARRQGQPGAYADMFAPTEKDLRGIRLFTGETVRSRVGIAHQLGEESCRLLVRLHVPTPAVQTALQRAIDGMTARLDEAERRGQSTALYCCGTCSAAYWRNLALNLFPRSEERLCQGLVELKQLRRSDGQWHRFPFYFTSLALTEIGTELALAELQHAAARWQKILPRLSAVENPMSRRRAAVGQRLLALCAS